MKNIKIEYNNFYLMNYKMFKEYYIYLIYRTFLYSRFIKVNYINKIKYYIEDDKLITIVNVRIIDYKFNSIFLKKEFYKKSIYRKFKDYIKNLIK